MRVEYLTRLCMAALLAALSVTAAAADTLLLDSVKRADADALRALLRQGSDVNAADPDGTTALHWAVHESHLEIVDLLIRAGANVNAANRYGVAPIHLACTNQNPAIVESLLKAGANANAALADNETALMTAARTGDVATVKLLLAHGADIDAKEHSQGQTALMWAAAENNAAVVKLLLEVGADNPSAAEPTPAAEDEAAAKIGQITQAAPENFDGAFTAFLFAVRAGHLEAVNALLDAGVSPNESLPDGTPALTLAIINGHYELAAVLLDRGADPNAGAQGWSALHQISWTRRPNTGFNLPGAQPTGKVGSLDLVRKLLQKGANVNARQRMEPKDGNRHMASRIGATPFLVAAKAADVQMMRLLLEHGADPTIPTADGMTSLMAAAGVGIWAPGESPGSDQEALTAVKLILEVGAAEVNAVDKNGYTALHGAIHRGGFLPLVQLLADQGAKLDARNSKGWTPLTIADGVEYTPTIFKRYPETATLLRRLMKERGLEIPPPPSEQQAVVGGP